MMMMIMHVHPFAKLAVEAPSEEKERDVQFKSELALPWTLSFLFPPITGLGSYFLFENKKTTMQRAQTLSRPPQGRAGVQLCLLRRSLVQQSRRRRHTGLWPAVKDQHDGRHHLVGARTRLGGGLQVLALRKR